MRTVLDTSALLRFFTNDVPQKAAEVERVLKTEKHIIVPEVVLPELEYVLSGVYNQTREQILHIFRFLVTQKHIIFESHIMLAVSYYEHTTLDMADCMIAAQAKKGKLVSFDKRLLKCVEGS